MLLRSSLAFALFAALLPAQVPRTETDAQALEARLDSNPEDLTARAQLIRFYQYSRPASMTTESARPLRRKHIVWMIEHHPENAVLADNVAVIDKSGHALADPDGWTEADKAWRHVLSTPVSIAEVYANAINFYKTADASFALHIAEQGLEAFPNHAKIMGAKGSALAYTVLGIRNLDQYGRATAFDDAVVTSKEAAAARKEIEASSNADLIGRAAMVFDQQRFPLTSHNRPKEAEDAAALTERLYTRAIDLAPSDNRWKSGLANAYQNQAAQKHSPAEKIPLLVKAADLAPSDSMRGYVLPDLANAYFDSGNLKKASETANTLLDLAGRSTGGNVGGAIHTGNIVLGRVALKEDHVEEAKKRLLAAGRTPGSPVLGSFGPNWNLAQELLAKGERDTVLAYIDLCRIFWKSGQTRLDSWASTISSGGSPNFFGSATDSGAQLLGRAAPEFRLKTLAGPEVSLGDFKGKIVLIDFWATWCAPCRAEMPEFEKLYRDLGGKDVVILALDADEPADTVAEFIKKEKYTFPVLLSEGTDVVKKYGINAFPTTLAVDKSGRVAEVVVGNSTNTASRLQAAIDKARAGAPPPPPESRKADTQRPMGGTTVATLPSPKLLSPDAGAVFDHYPRLTTLVWTEVPGAVSYVVEWDYKDRDSWTADLRGTEGATIPVRQPVASFRFVGAQPGRWRVWAIDAAGRPGPKSEWREFRYTK